MEVIIFSGMVVYKREDWKQKIVAIPKGENNGKLNCAWWQSDSK